jgi:hypothetical protein
MARTHDRGHAPATMAEMSPKPTKTWVYHPSGVFPLSPGPVRTLAASPQLDVLVPSVGAAWPPG